MARDAPTETILSQMKEFFEVDCEGNLLWKKSKGPRGKVGAKVGTSTTHGRFRTIFLGKSYYNHRIIWYLHYGEWPNCDIDHKDNDPKNNKIENLRLCSRSQNCANKTSKRLYKGVYQKRDKWYSSILKEGKSYHLGTFNTPEKAALAYNDKATELFKDFAKLNRVEVSYG